MRLSSPSAFYMSRPYRHNILFSYCIYSFQVQINIGDFPVEGRCPQLSGIEAIPFLSSFLFIFLLFLPLLFLSRFSSLNLAALTNQNGHIRSGEKLVTTCKCCLFVCVSSPYYLCLFTLDAFQFTKFIDHKLFTPSQSRKHKEQYIALESAPLFSLSSWGYEGKKRKQRWYKRILIY